MTTTGAKRVHAPDATTAPGGALIGLPAGLALILVQFALRAVAGAAPPTQAVPDRFAPNLGSALFFRLLDLFEIVDGISHETVRQTLKKTN